MLVVVNLVNLALYGKLSSLLTVKTLTGMTTDVYPRENCIAPAIVLILSPRRIPPHSVPENDSLDNRPKTVCLLQE